MAKTPSLRISARKSNNITDSTAYPGLESVAGVRVVACPLSPEVACPFCGSTDLVLMVGKVSFSAIINGDDLFEGQPQPLVTVVCFNSHIFFLREKDLFEASVAA